MKKSERLGIRVTQEDKESWQRAAEKAGLSLSQWLTQLANNEVDQSFSAKL